MSFFQAGGTVVNFDASDLSFSSKSGNGGLEEITCTILIASASEWGALFSLRSWNVSVRPIPGGNTVYVDILGGAGEGTLALDNLDTHSAILTNLSRDFVEPGSLRSRAVATWLITN